ncbi:MULTISPECIES: porin family protein [Aestuariivivens]|uniref:porin family protein n=1 Tax=Aestuariivivens TaxID=1820275 RepID=UPI001CBC01E4|nr:MULTISPECIES: porin family protein [Aestuariivivens]
MKKLILFIAFLLFTCNNINAQENKLGIKTGLNVAYILGENTSMFDARASFHFGAIVDFLISDKFSIQPEVLYSCQGVTYNDGGYDGKFKLDYLNVPVVLKYKVVEGFSLECGPQIGVLLSAKNEFNSSEESGEEDIKDLINSTDFSINFGLGSELENGLFFSGRYILGISEIFKDNEGNNQNGVFQISIGYFF